MRVFDTYSADEKIRRLFICFHMALEHDSDAKNFWKVASEYGGRHGIVKEDFELIKNLSLEELRVMLTVNPKSRETLDKFLPNVGKRVKKTPISGFEKREPKPFKSGFKINTIKSVIIHPKLLIPAYTFEEDNSYVECRRCMIVE